MWGRNPQGVKLKLTIIVIDMIIRISCCGGISACCQKVEIDFTVYRRILNHIIYYLYENKCNICISRKKSVLKKIKDVNYFLLKIDSAYQINGCFAAKNVWVSDSGGGGGCKSIAREYTRAPFYQAEKIRDLINPRDLCLPLTRL